MPQKHPFAPEQFTSIANSDSTADRKARVANALVLWIERGFPESGFTNALYTLLEHHFSWSAEYNKYGFYSVWFLNTSSRIRFFRALLSEPFLGSPADTWSDVGQALKSWITTSGILTLLETQHVQEVECFERALLAHLQGKHQACSRKDEMNQSCSANAEMFCVAAWLATQPLVENTIAQWKRAEEEQSPKRVDVFAMMQTLLDQEVARVEQSGIDYGSVYGQLLRHHLTRVELRTVQAALLGEHGLAFHSGFLPLPVKEQETGALHSETEVLWEAITHDEQLLAKIRQLRYEWYGDVAFGGRSLRTFFSLSTPRLSRISQCAFFVPEFLQFSLKAVQWEEIAEHVLNIP